MLKALTAALAVLLVLPATAAAATRLRVDEGSARLVVDAGAGAANRIVVAPAGPSAFTVRDDGAPVDAGEGCTQTGAQSATCFAPGAGGVTVALGDGDDALDAGGTPAAVICGDGDDVVRAGPRAAPDDACERAAAGPLVVATEPVDRRGARLVYRARCPGPAPCAGRLGAAVGGRALGRSRALRLAPGAVTDVPVLLTERGWRTLSARWESDVTVTHDGGGGFTRRIASEVVGLREFLPFVLELGPQVEGMARGYDPRLSGAELLAKTLQGESRYRMDAVSSAGARGAAQFMPGSRRIVLRRYGVDPWRSPREAVAAMVLHLRGKVNGRRGLYGYNPGGHPWYTRYILRQPIPPLPE